MWPRWAHVAGVFGSVGVRALTGVTYFELTLHAEVSISFTGWLGSVNWVLHGEAACSLWSPGGLLLLFCCWGGFLLKLGKMERFNPWHPLSEVSMGRTVLSHCHQPVIWT